MADLSSSAPTITWDDFMKAEMRVGRIVSVEPFALCVPDQDVPLGTQLP